MRHFLARAALCAGPLVVVLSLCSRASAQAPMRSALQYDARVLRYDMENDRIYRAHSALTAPENRRPGGRTSYYGNRLRGYRYIGPAGQGGIYDALQEDAARRQFNPRNYQYRFRYPSAR